MAQEVSFDGLVTLRCSSSALTRNPLMSIEPHLDPAGLDEAISEYKTFKPDLQALREYMESGQWKQDFEADEAGQIPADVKRGVLSEDGLYDLLQGADKILSLAKEVL